MNSTTLAHLGELLRAGWAWQVLPEMPAPTMCAVTALVKWSRPASDLETFPIFASVSLWNFEHDFTEVVDNFYQRVFPIPRDGLAGSAPTI